VWWIGLGSVLQAVATNLAIAIGVIAIGLDTSALPSLQQLLIILVVVPLAIFIQGSLTISLIREVFAGAVGWFAWPMAACSAACSLARHWP